MQCVYCGKEEETRHYFHPYIPVDQLKLGVYRMEYDEGYAQVYGIFVADYRLMSYLIEFEPKVYFGEIAGKHSEVFFAPGKYCQLITSDPKKVEELIDLKVLMGVNPITPFIEHLTDEEEIKQLKEYLVK
jgi:hypothetical protein